MTEIIQYTNDYLAMISDYGSPDRHKHLTAHLVCALTGTLQCQLDHRAIECEGLLIYPDVEHKIQAADRMLVFLFANTSKITSLMEEKYLSGNNYAILPKNTVEFIRTEYLRGTDHLDERVLMGMSLYTREKAQFDERVADAVAELEAVETISEDTMLRLSQKACLSQSRLSHLFKKDIGISLIRYMSFMKMKKAYEYVCKGENLTDAALHAGFDSSSRMPSSA